MNIRVGDRVQWGSDAMWGTVTKVRNSKFSVLWSGNNELQPWTIDNYTLNKIDFSRHIPRKPTIIL